MTQQEVNDKLKDKVAVSTVVTPGPGAVNWRDVGYGALYAIVGACVPLISQMAHDWTFNPKELVQSAIQTLCGYLIVKFFSATRQITTFKNS